MSPLLLIILFNLQSVLFGRQMIRIHNLKLTEVAVLAILGDRLGLLVSIYLEVSHSY